MKIGRQANSAAKGHAMNGRTRMAITESTGRIQRRLGFIDAPEGSLTASSYAARRLRPSAFILGQLGRQATTSFPPASRVSISELLGAQPSDAGTRIGLRRSYGVNEEVVEIDGA